MRKFTILVALVAMTSYAMAQVSMSYAPEAGKQVQKAEVISDSRAVPVWQVTFEEDPAVWTLGSITGTKTWAVSDTTPDYGFTSANYEGGTVPVPPLWIYMAWRYVHDYSESGANFAWIDGISDMIGLGGNTMQVSDSYIQFDGIDLTGVANPKLTFYQDYKGFNGDASYIDFSTNGGTDWTTVQINADVEGNAYGDDYFEMVATSYIANQANVSIRFRWTTSGTTMSGYGYGWQIDDISITDNPDYDLKYIHARMNFYQYEDYTVAGSESYYHISSHYGNIPVIQYDYAGALSWFNVALKNQGNFPVTPDVKVQVFDPDMVEIFTTTVAGVEVPTAGIDTVDLIETDFALGASPMLGKYTVAYTVIVPGQEDANLTNNSDTTYFIINENYFGRDIDKSTAYTGPGNWLDGGLDGEMFGTDFLFLFEGQITSMDVFVNENTTPGTQIIGHIMQYDEGSSTWVAVGSSSLVDLTEENIGGWLNMTFSDDVYVVYDEGYESKTLMAAIEFYYYGEDNNIWIGYDPTVPVSSWGTKWYLTTGTNANTWISISNWSRGGLNIHVNFNGYTITGNQTPEAQKEINIYPNPTYGLLNIENVEGSNIQILNMMGQVVESIENANMVNTVNMNDYANGTYFVRVVNGNEVSTHKINLMK